MHSHFYVQPNYSGEVVFCSLVIGFVTIFLGQIILFTNSNKVQKFSAKIILGSKSWVLQSVGQLKKNFGLEDIWPPKIGSKNSGKNLHQ